MRALTTAALAMAIGGVAACGGGDSEVGGDGGSSGGPAAGVGGAGADGWMYVGGGGAAGDGGAGGDPGLGPPYPVVLCHGFFGFEEFAGQDFATYFYQVKETLAAEGEEVFTPAVDPFNTSEYRGEQLLAHVEAILEQTGHAKVNLVAHSQGGLDARYVAARLPNRIASVVTIATPHRGTPVADIAVGITPDNILGDLLDWFVQTIGAPIYDEIGNQTSLGDAMYTMSSEGIAKFNAKYPNQPEVFYASITGRSDNEKSDVPGCKPDEEVSFIAKYDADEDPIDPLFSIPETILDGGLGDPYPNDGLVRVIDARWGIFWGCIPADHVDEVGHLFGDDPGGTNDFDHKVFYSELIAHLRKLGY